MSNGDNGNKYEKRLTNTRISLSVCAISFMILLCDCRKCWINSKSSVGAFSAIFHLALQLKHTGSSAVMSVYWLIIHMRTKQNNTHSTHTLITTLFCTPLPQPATLRHSQTVSVPLLFRWSCWVRICAVFGEGDCVFWECIGSTAGQ